MRLKTLTLENFMPFKGEQVLSFPTSNSQNVVLVYGDNMRGKTSLLNAVRFALYGKAIGRHLRNIPAQNIPNSEALIEGSGRAGIRLEFETDGQDFEIRRYLKWDGVGGKPSKISDFEHELGLLRDGAPQRSDQITHIVNQIVPEQVSRFLLFDGELLEEYEMLLASESDQGQRIKAAIEQVLGVPALINARDESSTILRKSRRSLATATKHIAGLRAIANQQEALQEEIDGLEVDLGRLQEQKDGMEAEIQVLVDELDSTQAAEKAENELTGLKRTKNVLIEEEGERRDERRNLLRLAWKDLLRPRVDARLKHLDQIRSSFAETIRESGVVAEKVQQLELILSESRCPMCGQEVESGARDKAGSELGRLEVDRVEVEESMAELSKASSEIDQLSKLRPSNTGARIIEIEKWLRHQAVELTRVEARIEEIESQIASVDTAEIRRKRAKHNQLLKNLGKVESDIKDAESDLEENSRKLDGLSRVLSSKAKHRVQKVTHKVEVLEGLTMLFNEGIEVLRDRLREQVADLATKAFHQLTTEKTYKGLSINENYGLTIVDRKKKEVAERSAGAEQIVALSLIDGLNRTARKTGPIVMDTPLGRLDPRHRRNVLEFIPDMGEQVVLLVHEGEIDRERDLEPLVDRIAAVYEIQRVSSSESRLVLV